MKRFMVFAIMLISMTVFAQEGGGLPKIAVYVTGDQEAGANRALTTRLLAAFVNSKRYTAVERSDAFVSEIDREQSKQRSGAVDDEQISRLGRQSGVQFVCVANITEAFGSYQVSARIIDVETANVVAIGVADSPLETMDDLTAVSRDIVAALFGDGAAQTADRRTYIRAPSASTDDRSAYTLTTNVTPPGGGIVQINPNQTRYDAGTQVTITAVPSPGYRFVDWSGTITSTRPKITGQMNRDMTLTANFQEGTDRASSSEYHDLETKLHKYYLEFYVTLLGAPNTGATGEWTTIEVGRIWENRSYIGFEFGGGFFGKSEPLFPADQGWIGGGVNLGRMTSTQRFTYGLLVGVWGGYVRFEEEIWGWPSSQTQTESHFFVGFGGPFFKIRWNYFGITSRMFFGYGGEETIHNDIFVDQDIGFKIAWQVKLSLRFGIGSW